MVNVAAVAVEAVVVEALVDLVRVVDGSVKDFPSGFSVLRALFSKILVN